MDHNSESGANFEEIDPNHLAVLTSPIISDALDAVGRRDQVMTCGLLPLVVGSRIFGRAATIQFVPTEERMEEPYGDVIEFIDSLESGSVAVIATGQDSRTGYWGELFSAAAMGRGVSGAVCDGPVRDTPKVRGLGFPVFSAGTRPRDLTARMRVSNTNNSVRCATVLVAQGDLVLADDDGVVVIPANVEREVLALALSRALTEKTALAELLGGAKLGQVWDRWHVL